MISSNITKKNTFKKKVVVMIIIRCLTCHRKQLLRFKCSLAMAPIYTVKPECGGEARMTGEREEQPSYQAVEYHPSAME